MSRPLLMLVCALGVVAVGALDASPAVAENQKAGAIRRCGEQRNCSVIHENNGDVVIIVGDADGDGKGDGVIRCPAGSTSCSAMRKVPRSRNAYRAWISPVKRVNH
jgi:hypothetical protein